MVLFLPMFSGNSRHGWFSSISPNASSLCPSALLWPYAPPCLYILCLNWGVICSLVMMIWWTVTKSAVCYQLSQHPLPMALGHLKDDDVEDGLSLGSSDCAQLFSPEASEDFYCLHQSLGEKFFLTPNLVCSLAFCAGKPCDFFNHLSPLCGWMLHADKFCNTWLGRWKSLSFVCWVFFSFLIGWYLSRLMSPKAKTMQVFYNRYLSSSWQADNNLYSFFCIWYIKIFHECLNQYPVFHFLQQLFCLISFTKSHLDMRCMGSSPSEVKSGLHHFFPEDWNKIGKVEMEKEINSGKNKRLEKC